MVKNLFNNKAQSLPLNTIVIAVLVVIVLLVIIVFFTSNVGESGETLNQNSASACSISNPALATIYNDPDKNYIFKSYGEGGDEELATACDQITGGEYKSVIGVKNCCVLVQ